MKKISVYLPENYFPARVLYGHLLEKYEEIDFPGGIETARECIEAIEKTLLTLLLWIRGLKIRLSVL